ncbi:ImmA/IrrE family metallo-endopeptidase [Streptomyces xinghaiensis]|uniref:ImmA/IrrE family metallo-endopeptidase n=1 Tax=Streptomyces xinghaiensis TaxID=1038928 RepID=UPI002E146719|nr:ImmA/IrrE family metallo-endopeptidase [Streptomyces xinghaiensis]
MSSWLRDVRQLRGLGVLPERELWGYPGKAPDSFAYRTAARWVRERLGNARDPLGSMAEVCARAGQWPLVAAIPGDGASLIDGDIAVCIISEQGDPGRRRATAAHELGHLIMGDAYSNDLEVHASVDDRERAIEAFAAELLLPTVAIESRWIAGSPEREQLIGLAAQYRVSWTLALIQAERAEVIDSDHRNELTARRPARAEFLQALGWVPEADLSAVKVAPEYADAVLTALGQKLVTRVRAVEMLHGQVSFDDLPPDDDDGDC